MQPLVSIILPTYNGQQFLAQSIESCLNQTHKNIELIIVDDASTDETPEIIKRYSELDSRIKIITNAKNKKLPRSLNVGHQASTGEFITWTSDDNLYLPQAIERMMSFLVENEEVGMVYCDFDCINENGETTKKVIVGPKETMVSYNCIGACFLYRRSVYSKIGNYSSKYLYAEDFDYWLRVAANFSITPLHETLYLYRLHKNSLTSSTKTDRILKAMDNAIRKNLPSLKWVSSGDRYYIANKMTKKAFRKRDYPAVLSSLQLAIFSEPKLFITDFSAWILRLFRIDKTQ